MTNLENLFSSCWIMDCYYYSWINSSNKKFNRQMVVVQNYEKKELEKHLSTYIRDAIMCYVKVEKVIFVTNDSDIEEYDRNLYEKGNFIDKYWRDMSLYFVEGRIKVNNYIEEVYIQCIAPIDIDNSELKNRILKNCRKKIEIDYVSMHEDCWLKKN